MHREVDWSISMLPSLEDQIAYVDDDEIRSLVTHHTAYFTQHEQAWKQQLPQPSSTMMHDYNVIVAPDPHQAGHYHVNAIIDFGDMPSPTRGRFSDYDRLCLTACREFGTRSRM